MKEFNKRTIKAYHTTNEFLNELLDRQGGVCAICKSPGNLHVDHDHKCCPTRALSCGKCIRGFLCSNCNTGVGSFDDEPERIQSAINYLRRWK